MAPNPIILLLCFLKSWAHFTFTFCPPKCKNAIRNRNAKTQSEIAMQKRNLKLQLKNTIWNCKSKNAIWNLNAKTQSEITMKKRNLKLQCKNAIRNCNAKRACKRPSQLEILRVDWMTLKRFLKFHWHFKLVPMFKNIFFSLSLIAGLNKLECLSLSSCLIRLEVTQVEHFMCLPACTSNIRL
jgi:hypothetical protein